jgi:LAO/AO transport system kinase
VTESLRDRVLSGDPRALARAISLIEDGAPAASDLVRDVFPRTGRAYLVGITGPPGAGKSTLVDQIVRHARRGGRTVGVIAVDPTSPFTGGAILGDRVRMQQHAGDAGVFIRSMATRGQLGGLARGTSEVALLLDAAGRDLIIIETVGVGQDEIDIVRTADVSVVVLVPGTGDEVQALKAGIMEIADIFVVNKADREGADRTCAAVETVLALNDVAPGAWRPPVLRTEATTGRGVPEVMAAIDRFRAQQGEHRRARRRARADWRLRELVAERFWRHLEAHTLADGELAATADRIAARDLDPYSAADAIVARASRGQESSQKPGRLLTSPRVDGVDHVGIAVSDLAAALAFYHDALGLSVGEVEEVASQRVRAHFVPLAGTALELLEATSPDSPIAKFTAKRGPGLHHITLRVDDVHAALTRLKTAGVRLIDEAPRPGAHGSLVAFVHPAAAHGVLVELCQPAVSGTADPGPRTLDLGPRTAAPGPRTAAPGPGTPDPGRRTPDRGPRTSDPGPRTLAPGPRTLDLGPRPSAPGPRTPDPWTPDPGPERQ